MAVMNEKSTKLVIKVAGGTSESGKQHYFSRTINHIAPELSTDDAYAIATGLAGLQSLTVSAVQRVDSAELAEG